MTERLKQYIDALDRINKQQQEIRQIQRELQKLTRYQYSVTKNTKKSEYAKKIKNIRRTRIILSKKLKNARLKFDKYKKTIKPQMRIEYVVRYENDWYGPYTNLSVVEDIIKGQKIPTKSKKKTAEKWFKNNTTK